MHFKKLTATQFAEITNVQRSSISHVLSGRNKPSLDIIQKIVTEFPEVSFDWLINGKGSFNKSNAMTTDETKPTLDTNVTKQYQAGPTPSLNNFTNVPHSSVKHSPTPDPETFPTTNPHTDKEIDRIVVFYKDGTFKNYTSY